MRLHRRLLTAFLSLIVLALLASASLADPSVFGSSNGSRGDVTTEEPNDETCEEPPAEVEEPPAEGEECVSEEEEAPEEEEETDDGSEPTDADADAEREAACMKAAGVEPSEEGTDSDTQEVKAHGLDNAIEHVLSNCVKDTQSPGLLNALEHLAANRERHEAHEIWKAERKAEHDAAKAERDAAKAERKSGNGDGSHGNGHGSRDEHGNPHDSGSGDPQGNGHGK